MSKLRPPKILALLAISAGVAVLVLGANDSEGRSGLFFGVWRSRHLILASLLMVFGLLAFLASQSRRAVFGGVFVLLLGGSTIVMLEVIGLTGLVDYTALFGNDASILSNSVGASRKPNIDVAGETFQDIATGWGIEHHSVPFRYRTDEHGYRNDSGGPEANVYLVGDSIVVGALVDFDETVAGRLSAMPEISAMNVALIGISVQEAAALFDELATDVAGKDVFQFFFEGNDLLDSRTWRTRQEHDSGEMDDRLERSFEDSFVNNLALWLQKVTAPATTADRVTCSIDGVRYLFAWMSQSYEGLEAEIPATLGALEDFGRRVHEAGGRYYVVFVPSKFRVLAQKCDPGSLRLEDPGRHIGPMREVLMEWSTTAGIPVIDLTGPLEESARSGEMPWFWGDTHWNARGNEVAAETLAEVIAASDVRGMASAAVSR